MSGLTAKIPLSEIKKASVFVNLARQPMDQLKRLLGCDYILNAGLFDMKTFEPASYLISNGKTLCSTGNPYGYALNGPNVAYSYANIFGAPDFIGGYPVLISGGKKAWSAVPAGLEGDRGRSAMGLTVDSLVLRCVPDLAGAADYTLDELTADLLGLGCVTAINLDGGGSSQCGFKGERVTSGRTVHSFLCVWTDGSINNIYTNGASRRPVYETTACKKQIGSLDPYEICRLLEDGNDFKTVSYFITGTNIRKAGFICP